MSIGIIGKKIGMTRLYNEKGASIPVTVVQAGPCPVTQVKRKETDGYTAIQIGFDSKKEKRTSKAEAGHIAKSKLKHIPRVLREFRVEDVEGYETGSEITADLFEAGEKVDVTGTSKGRGFAGPMKRHNSSRGPETHGSRYHRRPGSLGQSATPSRVYKGRKQSGQMGNTRVTIQSVKVFAVNTEKNLILIHGQVPGHNNSYVMIRKAAKVRLKKANA